MLTSTVSGATDEAPAISIRYRWRVLSAADHGHRLFEHVLVHDADDHDDHDDGHAHAHDEGHDRLRHKS